MLTILYNNFIRLLQEKAYIIVAILLTICSVTAAIVLTNKIEIKSNLAIVSTNSNIEFKPSKYFNITKLSSKPPKSGLIQNRYDAVITMENGEFTIETMKNDEFKNMLYAALKSPGTFVQNTDTSRKIGTNIIGYMMMFLLMQGVLYGRLFAEDKEKHIIERIAMSPTNFTKYLLGNAIFIIMIIFVPSFVIILAAKILGADIGFSLLQYAGLITVLSILSTAFGLFMNSLFCESDTPNMLGSSIVVLTSILTGSFYSFTKENTMFNKFLHILPQKDFMGFMDCLEKGTVSQNAELQLIYVVLLSLILLTFAIMKTKKDYIYHQ